MCPFGDGFFDPIGNGRITSTIFSENHVMTQVVSARHQGVAAVDDNFEECTVGWSEKHLFWESAK